MDIFNIMEIMELRVNDGVTEADFLKATRDLIDFVVQTQKANMKLLKGSDNKWIVLTTYGNEGEAQTFFPELMAHPLARRWIQMIDRTSIQEHTCPK